MKKFFAVLIIAVAACFAISGCFVFAGCNSSSSETPGSSSTPPAEQTPEGSSTPTQPEQPPADEQPEKEEITKMYLTVNSNKIEVTLAENSAVDALVEILKQGDITYTASDYGGFEKVGSPGHTLPTSDTEISTQPGDVILYSGNQIVLFYGSNTWSYTRLGRMNGYSVSELKTLLGAGKGSIQVTISLS